MVTESVVLGAFGATLHDERAHFEALLCLGDSFGEGVVVADNLLTVNDKVAIVVTSHQFVLMLEIILELFI